MNHDLGIDDADQEAGMGTDEVEVEKGIEIEPGARDQVSADGPADQAEDEVEVQAPRAVRAPYVPSAKEVEAHELTHCPFRQWCDHCVRGQAKDVPRTTVRGELADSTVVRVTMGYCFLTDGAWRRRPITRTARRLE